MWATQTDAADLIGRFTLMLQGIGRIVFIVPGCSHQNTEPHELVTLSSFFAGCYYFLPSLQDEIFSEILHCNLPIRRMQGKCALNHIRQVARRIILFRDLLTFLIACRRVNAFLRSSLLATKVGPILLYPATPRYTRWIVTLIPPATGPFMLCNVSIP
jgi:hypothetical protein